MLRRAPLCVLLLASLLSATPAAAASAAAGPLTPQLAELARPSVRALGERAQALRLDFAAERPRQPGPRRRTGAGRSPAPKGRRGHGRWPLPGRGSSLSTRRSGERRCWSRRPTWKRWRRSPRVVSVEAVPAPLVAAADCEGGSVLSEGVAQLHADLARAEHGVERRGGHGRHPLRLLRPGDESRRRQRRAVATQAATDVETADLPGPASGCAGEEAPVHVLHEHTAATPEVFDEGRAMAQTVHDVAPQASLAFASAFNGELAFAQAIEQLAAPVASGGAGAGRDRRRRLLLRRALLPERAGRRRGRKGRRRRGRLRLGRRQQQPLRQPRQRNRLLGSAEIPRQRLLPGDRRRARLAPTDPTASISTRPPAAPTTPSASGSAPTAPSPSTCSGTNRGAASPPTRTPTC